MPRFDVLTAGFKIPVSTTFLFGNATQTNVTPPSSFSTTSNLLQKTNEMTFADQSFTPTFIPLSNYDDGPYNSDLDKKRDKRKSRLETTKYLPKRQSIGEEEREKVYLSGMIHWFPKSLGNKVMITLMYLLL